MSTTSGTAARRLARSVGIGVLALLLGAGTGMSAASATEDADTRPASLKEAHVGATAEDFAEHGDCPDMGNGEGEDGFHFVMPGEKGAFHSLTVTFDLDPETEVVDEYTVTLSEGDFGPKSDKHAYVNAPAGAELVSGEAEVSGGKKDWFVLSHTCPGTPDEEPTEEPTDEPTEEPTDEPTEEPTDEPTDEPTEEPTEGGGGGTTPTEEPTASPTEGGGGGTAPTEEPSEATGGGDVPGDQGGAVGGALAETGGNLPLLLGAAAALLVVGGLLSLTPARKVLTGRHRR